MFFIKQRKDKASDMPAIRIVAAKWINLNKRVASFLQVKFEKLSDGRKKLCLIFFCLLFGGSSVLVLIEALKHDDKKTGIVKISKTIKTPLIEHKPDSAITKAEYERVEAYKNHIRELNKTKEGKQKADSLLALHPGLLDSIAVFENIYLSQ